MVLIDHISCALSRGRHSDSTNTSLQTPFFHSGFLWFPKEASRRKKRKNFQRELTSNHSALNSLEGIWRCSKYLPSHRCQQVISCTILFYDLTCFLKFLWFFSHGISPYSTEELGLRYRMKGLRFRGNCFIPQLGLLLITRNKQSHCVQEKQVLRSRFRLQVRVVMVRCAQGVSLLNFLEETLRHFFYWPM